MRRNLLILLVIGLVLSGVAIYKGATREVCCKISHEEELELKLAARDATDAQRQFQIALSALQSKGNDIKKAHSWGDDVSLDFQTLTFKQQEPKKDGKKK